MINSKPTPKIKHILQQDRSGCGLACAAMVTGNSYKTVRYRWTEVIFGDPKRLDRFGDGLNGGELVLLVAHLLTLQQGSAFLSVEIGKTGLWTIIGQGWAIKTVKTKWGGHWVVEVPEFKVFDPAKNK